MMSVEQNKQVIRRALSEVWTEDKAEVIPELCTENMVMHDVTGDFVGLDAYKRRYTLYRSAFPDLQCTVEAQVGEENFVATRWVSTGTHQGELMGIPPSGKRIVSVGIAFSRFAGGKVVEEWNYWDAVGLLQQLGVVPDRGRTQFGWTEPSQVTGDPGDPEANRQLMLRHIGEVWTQRNVDVLNEIMTEDVVDHEATTEFVFGQGVEANKRRVLSYLTAFPDLRGIPHERIVEGDLGAMRWTATGTHKGDLLGIPATGKQATWGGITMYRFVGGKIAELWWAWNSLSLMQQLGVIPPMGG